MSSPWDHLLRWSLPLISPLQVLPTEGRHHFLPPHGRSPASAPCCPPHRTAAWLPEPLGSCPVGGPLLRPRSSSLGLCFPWLPEAPPPVSALTCSPETTCLPGPPPHQGLPGGQGRVPLSLLPVPVGMPGTCPGPRPCWMGEHFARFLSSPAGTDWQGLRSLPGIIT